MTPLPLQNRNLIFLTKMFSDILNHNKFRVFLASVETWCCWQKIFLKNIFQTNLVLSNSKILARLLEIHRYPWSLNWITKEDQIWAFCKSHFLKVTIKMILHCTAVLSGLLKEKKQTVNSLAAVSQTVVFVWLQS